MLKTALIAVHSFHLLCPHCGERLFPKAFTEVVFPEEESVRCGNCRKEVSLLFRRKRRTSKLNRLETMFDDTARQVQALRKKRGVDTGRCLACDGTGRDPANPSFDSVTCITSDNMCRQCAGTGRAALDAKEVGSDDLHDV